MVQPSPLFKVVSEEPEAPVPDNTAMHLVQVAFAVLSTRAAVILAGLFTLLTVGSAFVLWLMIPDPNTHQLIAMGMYGAFVIIINAMMIWSRK